MVKLGLADSAQNVDSTAIQKYESIFAKLLSESKHKAFKVLFQDKAFLDDIAPLTRFWPSSVKELDCAQPQRPSTASGG